MLTIRRWHSYLGFFIAPSVLFFTLTGALQLFGLHEAHGSYTPPVLVEKLSSVHKDQEFAFGDHHEPASSTAGADSPPAAATGHDATKPEEKTEIPTLLLKWFFLLVSLGLVVSTAFGLWMGLNQPNRRKAGWLLLAAGTVVPLVLLAL